MSTTGRIRKLFVEVTTKWVGEAKLKAVKLAGDAASASLRQLSDVADGIAARAVGTALNGSAGGGRRTNPEAAAARAAETAQRNQEAQARRQAREEERAAKEFGRKSTAPRAARGGARAGGGPRVAVDPLDGIMRDARRSGAANAGLAAGTVAIHDAARALDPLASAADKAKARISDLTSQVERNRKEMAALKAQTIQTGDADGTLAARMKGLSVATLDVQSKLGGARRELRAIDGSLIDAIKSSGSLKERFSALSVAAGTIIAGTVSRAWSGVQDAIVGSAKAAMDFQTTSVDIQKVARGADETAAGMAKIEAGIKAASKELGVLPNQVGQLAAQITPVFSGKEDIVALTKDVTKIGVAWGVSGEAAGKYFADISRGLQLSANDTKDLFGSINELSNQMGIKAADIASAVADTAGPLKAAGLSPETGAALNATLIATGASADVAATGVTTFVRTLGSGFSATDKQRDALERLSKTQSGAGLTADSLSINMAKGGKEAESQILNVVKAVGELEQKDKLPVLIELFGSMSIGTIGAAATATDALAKSFQIAGGTAGNFNSVLKEYERASGTSAAKVEKLKANIAVLAISLGDKLMPHIDRVVAFLTSKEGQEWGESAVTKAAAAVETFATLVGGAAKVVGGLVDTFGGVATAATLMGGALAIALGPWGALAAAAVASIGLITSALTKTNDQIIEMDHQTRRLTDNKMFKDAADAVDRGELKGEAAEAKAKELRQALQDKKNALTRNSSKSLSPEAIRRHGEQQAKERADINTLEMQLSRVEYAAGLSSKDRVAREAKDAEEKRKADEDAAAYGTPEQQAASKKIADQEELAYLRSKRKKGTLRESEKAQIRELEKSTDAVVEKRGGGGRGNGFNDEQKRIAAEARGLRDGDLGGFIDKGKLAAGTAQRLGNAGGFQENYHLKAIAGGNPELAKLLQQGRDKSEKGKIGTARNELDKLVEDKIINGPSTLGALGGRGADAVAGPSINTRYEYHQKAEINIGGITVESKGETTTEQVRSAGRKAGEVVVRGWEEAAIEFGADS